VWAESLPKHAAQSVVASDSLPSIVAPSKPSPAAVKSKKGKEFISRPFNVRHKLHVAVDESSPTGLKGLPPKWEALLKSSGISRDQVSAHPQEVLDVLQFHMEGPPPKLPKKAQLAAAESKASVITPGDPSGIFKSLTRLGEGYVAVLRCAWLLASCWRVACCVLRVVCVRACACVCACVPVLGCV